MGEEVGQGFLRPPRGGAELIIGGAGRRTRAAARLGVELHPQTAVTGLMIEGGRITGVQTTRGTVHAGFDAFTSATCYQGYEGATEACQRSSSPQRAAFSATRELRSGEQLTVVTALRKGAVSVPAPMLERREREFEEYFSRDSFPGSARHGRSDGTAGAGAGGAPPARWSIAGTGSDSRSAGTRSGERSRGG